MSVHRNQTMKLFLLFCCFLSFSMLHAQNDSLPVADSSVASSIAENKITPIVKPDYYSSLKSLLIENRFLNTQSLPVALIGKERNPVNKNLLFYGICITVLFFALLKTFYARFFNNIFRVFFNTSLRQSQITDQLVQAKLPSLFFNIFFVLIGGFYIYLLLVQLGHIDDLNNIKLLLICMAAVSLVYLGKYIILKFAGWVSGYNVEADTYIFIIFLINKIIAIALIPVVIIMAFSGAGLVKFIVLLSYLMITLMLVARFFRSYSILQNKIQVQRLHFFLYILGIEILPLLLIYKSTLNLLTNYL